MEPEIFYPEKLLLKHGGKRQMSTSKNLTNIAQCAIVKGR